jgi:hypothetical protein
MAVIMDTIRPDPVAFESGSEPCWFVAPGIGAIRIEDFKELNEIIELLAYSLQEDEQKIRKRTARVRQVHSGRSPLNR